MPAYRPKFTLMLERVSAMKKFAAIALLWASSLGAAAFGQVFTTLYLPTAGSGLTLNIATGRAFCGGSVVTYAGGTLAMAASVTNRVYLNTASSCAPAVKSSAFTTGDIPVATVVTSGSAITSLTDARTMMNQTLVASQVVSSINGAPGSFTFTGAGVSCVGTTCTFTGGGGSGVQYNPTTSVYYFLSASVMADDGHNTSPAVAAGAWSCNGATCSVHTTAAHNLTTSSWVDLTSLTGWFSGNPLGGQQDTTFGSFKVASVSGSNDFTVAYTRNTGSGSGGSVYDASFWPVYTVAQQPFFNGHGTALYWWSPLSSAASNINTFLTCTASPTYLVIQAGQNDVFAGRTSGQIEGNLQTIWATAHSKGCKVAQETLLPTNFGLSVTNQMWQTIQEVNKWIRYQGPQQAKLASGQYWDFPIDVAPYSADGLTDKTLLAGNGPAGSINFAEQINDAFGHQGGKLSVAPITIPWETGVALTPQNYFILSDAAGPWLDAVVFDQAHDKWIYNQLYGTGGTTTPLFEYNWSNAANGNHICNKWQINTTTNNSFSLCLGYNSSGSVLNYFGIAGGSGGTTDIIKLFADGKIQTPNFVSGYIQVDGSGNWSVGNPAATWGGIGGTLSAQTDLQTALNAKAPTASPTLTGTVDASGAAQVKLPVAAGYASLANGEVGYDSTNKNFHAWINGVDTVLIPLANSFVSGHCAAPTLSVGSWSLVDAGGPCGISGGGVTSWSGDGVLFSNSGSTGVVVGALANAAAHKFFGNNTGSTAAPGYQSIGAQDVSPNEYAAGGGTANAQTVTLSPAATSLVAGLTVRWLPTAANTTAATLAVSGLTAKSITKCGTTALAANDLTTAAVAIATYDGTQYQLLNPQAAGCGAGGGTSGAWTNITNSLTCASTGGTVSNSSGGYCATTNTASSVVALSGIGAHNRMQIQFYGGAQAGTNQPSAPYLLLNFNNDTTAAHYTINEILQVGTVAPQQNGGTSLSICTMGQLETGGRAGIATMDVPFYADTNFSKATNGTAEFGTVGESTLKQLGCTYLPTTAITSFQLTAGSGGSASTFANASKIVVLVQD
jgi:hypothetical protein